MSIFWKKNARKHKHGSCLFVSPPEKKVPLVGYSIDKNQCVYRDYFIAETPTDITLQQSGTFAI
jgi:hypothetical protein